MGKPILKALQVPILSALPTGMGAGDHGTLISYTADQAAGVQWWLQYRHYQADNVTVDPSTYKWHYIGGTALYNAQDPEGFVAATAYGDQNIGVGPTITVPLAGDYDVTYGARFFLTGTSGSHYMAIAVNGVASDTEAIEVNAYGTSDASARLTRKTGIPAAAVLKPVYRQSVVVNSFYASRKWLAATPVRVG
jgi:hypothetical protein